MAKNELVVVDLVADCQGHAPGYVICYATGKVKLKEDSTAVVEKAKRRLVSRALCVVKHFSFCSDCPNSKMTFDWEGPSG